MQSSTQRSLPTPPLFLSWPARRRFLQISALHIESVLLEHPSVAEVAVLGLPDETYGEARRGRRWVRQGSLCRRLRGRCGRLFWLGPRATAAAAHPCPLPPTNPPRAQRIAAVVALQPPAADLALPELRGWAAERLPRYQLPQVLRVVPAIPRNAMGKVNKKELRAALFPTAGGGTTGAAAGAA